MEDPDTAARHPTKVQWFPLSAPSQAGESDGVRCNHLIKATHLIKIAKVHLNQAGFAKCIHFSAALGQIHSPWIRLN